MKILKALMSFVKCVNGFSSVYFIMLCFKFHSFSVSVILSDCGEVKVKYTLFACFSKTLSV